MKLNFQSKSVKVLSVAMLFIFIFLVSPKIHDTLHINIANAVEETPKSDSLNDLDFKGVVHIFTSIACIAIRMVGAIMIIWGIWSAIKFLTAGGSPENFQNARMNITWYLIGGVILVAYPWILKMLSLVLSGVFGFSIPDIVLSC